MDDHYQGFNRDTIRDGIEDQGIPVKDYLPAAGIINALILEAVLFGIFGLILWLIFKY